MQARSHNCSAVLLRQSLRRLLGDSPLNQRWRTSAHLTQLRVLAAAPVARQCQLFQQKAAVCVQARPSAPSQPQNYRAA